MQKEAPLGASFRSLHTVKGEVMYFKEKPHLSRRQMQECIESAEGYLAGFELIHEGRGPWVWVEPTRAPDYRPQGPNVLECKAVRLCTKRDIDDFIKLLQWGQVVLRVIYVRAAGRSCFAVLRLD